MYISRFAITVDSVSDSHGGLNRDCSELARCPWKEQDLEIRDLPLVKEVIPA